MTLKTKWYYHNLIDKLDIGEAKKCRLRGAVNRLVAKGIEPNLLELSTYSRKSLTSIRGESNP